MFYGVLGPVCGSQPGADGSPAAKPAYKLE
jgi:hypothetical protein